MISWFSLIFFNWWKLLQLIKSRGNMFPPFVKKKKNILSHQRSVNFTWLFCYFVSSIWSQMCFDLQCLPADTLAIYSINEQSRLDGQHLQELCPTMLQQLDVGTCRTQNEEELSSEIAPRPSDAEGEHSVVVLMRQNIFKGYQ